MDTIAPCLHLLLFAKDGYQGRNEVSEMLAIAEAKTMRGDREEQ
jgi:hypothetical protein